VYTIFHSLCSFIWFQEIKAAATTTTVEKKNSKNNEIYTYMMKNQILIVLDFPILL
jgi:hypothetical protein